MKRMTYAVSLEREEPVEVNGFGIAVVKAEGTNIEYDSTIKRRQRSLIPSCYVERRVPVLLETEVHNLIDSFLMERGYKDFL